MDGCLTYIAESASPLSSRLGSRLEYGLSGMGGTPSCPAVQTHLFLLDDGGQGFAEFQDRLISVLHAADGVGGLEITFYGCALSLLSLRAPPLGMVPARLDDVLAPTCDDVHVLLSLLAGIQSSRVRSTSRSYQTRIMLFSRSLSFSSSPQPCFAYHSSRASPFSSCWPRFLSRTL